MGLDGSGFWMDLDMMRDAIMDSLGRGAEEIGLLDFDL